MQETHSNIFDLSSEDLQQAMTDWGYPSFRSRQIWEGLYQQLWRDPEEYSTLPAELRTRLSEKFNFSPLNPVKTLYSRDGETVKTLFKLSDGRAIEAVLMRYSSRNTLCISTQAGCAMGCVFCATGQMGFQRNLSAGEIVAQVIYYARQLKQEGQKVTNVVVMGMGEPFHNYDATLLAIDRLNDAQGLGLGARRFTISTSGLVPMINRFAAEKRQVNLAISLHAVDDASRSAMMPINRKYPIKTLLEACRAYADSTGRRVTFEWALIRDVNDSPETARRLAALLKGLLSHVNVIPLNPTAKYPGQPTPHDRALAFKAELEKLGIPCTIRIRRGIDIQAGCGQLASETVPNP